MASGFEFFERDLKLATAGLEPDAINKALAAFARQELRRVISTGEASSTYDKFVNGVQGAAEETVKAPGPILYQFVNWPAVIRFALEDLDKRVPKKSGRYAGGFMVLANQMPVRDYKDVPPGAEVTIINVRPYTRRMETGANKTGKRHFEATKNALARRYKDVFLFDFKFLNVKAGLHPDVPYVLKRAAGRRKDRQAGMPITYPALIIRAA